MANTSVKDTNFNMKINGEKKETLTHLFNQLGMTMPEAVNIFFDNCSCRRSAFRSKAPPIQSRDGGCNSRGKGYNVRKEAGEIIRFCTGTFQ